MMDKNLSETSRVLFQKYKFEKLVHLVGFIIRLHHDAQSSECRTHSISSSALADISSYVVGGMSGLLGAVQQLYNETRQCAPA
jgi:hypothetical protein